MLMRARPSSGGVGASNDSRRARLARRVVPYASMLMQDSTLWSPTVAESPLHAVGSNASLRAVCVYDSNFSPHNPV